jgi:hypothetical protein
VENTPDKLHPLMTVTALSVTVASLATLGVITGVIPERGEAAAFSPAGAAVAAFATPLASTPFSFIPPSPACTDCAIVEAVRLLRFDRDSVTGVERWEIAVRMRDGSYRMLPAESQPSWHAGDRVRIVNGRVISM